MLPGNLIERTPAESGIFHVSGHTNVNAFEEVSGASAADYDGDGDVDLFLGGGYTVANKLYRNAGDGTFADVAATAGVSNTGMATSIGLFFDYDNDGDLDLLSVGHFGQSFINLPGFRLFRNGGAATNHQFFNVMPQAGFTIDQSTAKLTNAGYASGACAADFDQDGFADVFASWSQGIFNRDQWRLMMNQVNPNSGNSTDPAYSPRKFFDKTKNSGLDAVYPGEPWQVVAYDINRDSFPDIHIAIDGNEDRVFMNDGDLTFTEVANSIGINGTPSEFRNEMGVALGDIDNDLDLDLHSTNRINVDRCYRNDSVKNALAFVDVAPSNGTENSPYGWGDVFFDFDNDGDLDHASVSGFEHQVVLPWINRLHLNLYPALTGDGQSVAFVDVTDQVPSFSKVDTPQGDSSRGLTWLDFDNDGDVDLCMTRNADTAAVFENTLVTADAWLQLDLVGDRGSLNTTGTQVYLRANGVTQYREVITGSSYLCQEPPRLHFGLGSPLQSDLAWIVVKWQGNHFQIVRNLRINRIHTIAKAPVDDRGDMDGDGHLDPLVDLPMLQLLATAPSNYLASHPDTPGLVTGDIDGDGVIDGLDVVAWSLLPPH